MYKGIPRLRCDSGGRRRSDRSKGREVCIVGDNARICQNGKPKQLKLSQFETNETQEAVEFLSSKNQKESYPYSDFPTSSRFGCWITVWSTSIGGLYFRARRERGGENEKKDTGYENEIFFNGISKWCVIGEIKFEEFFGLKIGRISVFQL